MPTASEIREKVRELEIIGRKFSAELTSGEYHTAFRGKGMRFKEVREYYPGDDIRFIDWNVSARYAHPFTKVFEEERELSIMLLVDISSSTLFGTRLKKKRDLITELSATIAFNSINNNDKVGILFFGNEVTNFIPPRKGRNQALHIAHELVTLEPQPGRTDINNALKVFNKNTVQKNTVFLISDFYSNNYEQSLKSTGYKHDLIGIRVYDKMDESLPDIGLVRAKDAETEKSIWLDTSDVYVRNNYHKNFLTHSAYCENAMKKSGADLINLKTDDEYLKALKQFFNRRRKIKV